MKERGAEAQEAADKNDSKTLYHIVRELTGARSNSNVPIKDKNEKIPLAKEEQDARWIEHFKETLNQPPPTATYVFDTSTHAADLEVNQGEITAMEIITAIKSLKNNKAPGLDQITAEMLKHRGDITVPVLTRMFNEYWQGECVPSEWRRGVIVKLPKKANIADCNDWRGITLLSVPGKAFTVVLLQRLREAVDRTQREEQAGFRPSRSCSEQIFALRNIIEQSVEFQKPLSVNFIDFRKAFDSVHRDSFWSIARTYGIPQRFVNIFRNLYLCSSCCIKTTTAPRTFLLSTRVSGKDAFFPSSCFCSRWTSP